MTAWSAPVSFLSPKSDRTLVEQIVDWYAARIDERVIRAGTRMPSVRQFAAEHSVSRFTVVEAYDRLIARGYLESRRGSGFFVRERGGGAAPAATAQRAWAEAPAARIDVVWLLRNMFKKLPAHDMPGCGVLPPDWLDDELIAGSLRALGRMSASAFLDYGQPQGYPPLRQQLQLKLAGLEIAAAPEQIVTTNGVSQALDLVSQHFLRPGDTVLVDEPSWFLMFGRFALLGARVIGVPRLPDGPDIERLRALAAEHRPKLFITVSVLHNPTSTSTSAARAFQLLRLAEEFDFMLVEDDIYCDLHPGPAVQPCIRLASMDQLRRVIYLSGFSKTLAANLRVGFIACEPELARQLTDLKMLVGLTSPEFGERIVYRVLSEGYYRRHLDRLRERLAAAHEPMLRLLERLGLRPFATPGVGMFVWADAGVDTNPVAQAMLDRGYLMAPGSLFLPDQRPSSWMRLNIATSTNPAMIEQLDASLQRARG
ncbi:MAG: PLP-dependent aminotransferase family protein [Burkholderiales bacterium]|nr:PLP-dependent aminotransferase family protein [Burkholderiales bacterium]